MKSLTCERARRLLSDLLAGALAADEADGLDAHLGCCDLCRADAEALVWQDRALAELATHANLAQLTEKIHSALAAEGAAPQPTTPSPVPEAAGQGAHPGRPWCWLAASAAGLLIGLTFLLWPFGRQQPLAAVAVARVDQIKGEVYVVGGDRKTPAWAGQELFPGDGLQVGEDGNAVVTCPDSTRLELGAATTLNWPAQGAEDRSVYLTEGVVTADMAEVADGPPMVLATPQAEVAAPGARLVLQGAADSTRIELEKGRAQVKDRKDGRMIDLRPGVLAVGEEKEGATRRPLAPHSRTARATLGGHTGGAWSLAFASGGATLAVGGGDGTVRLWETATGQPLARQHEHKGLVRALAFSPDGKLLATAGDDRTLRCWDVTTEQGRLIPKGGASPVYALQFSPDGQTLTAANWARVVNRWEVATGKQHGKSLKLGKPRSGGDLIGAMAFAADGKLLLWGSKDHTATLCDLDAGKVLHTLRGHDAPVVAAALSPDGAVLATGARDRTARLWDAATGQPRATLRGHRHTVTALAFAPDGKTLASAGADATVRLWDVATSQEARALEGHTGSVLCVAFAPDGKTLASGGADGTVRLWDMPLE